MLNESANNGGQIDFNSIHAETTKTICKRRHEIYRALLDSFDSITDERTLAKIEQNEILRGESLKDLRRVPSADRNRIGCAILRGSYQSFEGIEGFAYDAENDIWQIDIGAPLANVGIFAPLMEGEQITALRVYRHAGDERPFVLKSRKAGKRLSNDSTEKDARQSNGGFFSKTLLDGKLTIEVDCRKSAKKQIVTARNCNSILHADEFSINDAARRAKFVNAIGFEAADFSENAEREVLQTLINLTDSVNNHDGRTLKSPEAIQTTFAELYDGRVIEQIAGNRFAVYDAANDSFTYETSVTDAESGKTHLCDDSDVFTNNELYLATELTEYGTEIELDKDIEAYLHKHVDLTPRSQTLCAKYARMTYITDKLKELPYLRGIGQSGNGKTRMCHTVGLASYRPIFSVNPTRAVLYRLIEAYKPTMILDEANFDDSDDTAAMIQVLNCGFQRITSKIQRCEPNAFGKQDVKFFDCFGAKIICSLEKMRSQAYESRGIEIKMFVTTRNDIDFCLSQELLDDAQIIRNKLTLWRLRNLRNDFEAWRKTAQKELREKSKSKIPRSIQVATQLYALITDADSKQDFVEMLSERNATDAAQKQTTLDGEIISIIHDLLFETDADGNLKEKTTMVCGEPCEVLTVKAILEKLNEDLADKEKHKREYIGKQISQKLNLATKKIWSGENRGYAAIVFDVVMLENLFKNYALPLFAEIHGCNGCNGSNCKGKESLPLQPLSEKQGEKSATVAAVSDNENNNLDAFATVATVKTPETGGDKLFDSSLLTEPNKNAPENQTQERCWNSPCRALLQGATRCPSCDQNQDDIPF